MFQLLDLPGDRQIPTGARRDWWGVSACRYSHIFLLLSLSLSWVLVLPCCNNYFAIPVL